MKLIGILTLCIISFFVGSFLQKWELLESGAVEIIAPLDLQSSPESIGKLPASTILYPYSFRGEVATYIVFINMKQLDITRPKSFEHQMVVSPLSGYIDSPELENLDK